MGTKKLFAHPMAAFKLGVKLRVNIGNRAVYPAS